MINLVGTKLVYQHTSYSFPLCLCNRWGDCAVLQQWYLFWS